MNNQRRERLEELFKEIAEIAVAERLEADSLLTEPQRADALQFSFRVPHWSVDLGYAKVTFKGTGYFKRQRDGSYLVPADLYIDHKRGDL